MDPDSCGLAGKCSGRENVKRLVTALTQLISAESSSMGGGGSAKVKEERKEETSMTARALTSITHLAND